MQARRSSLYRKAGAGGPDPQLAGLMNWVYAKEDITAGIGPMDSTLSFIGGASTGTLGSRLCFTTSGNHISDCIRMTTASTARSPFFCGWYYRRDNHTANCCLRLFRKYHRIYYTRPGAGHETVIGCWDSGGTSRTSRIQNDWWPELNTWVHITFLMRNTTDGGNGRPVIYKNGVLESNTINDTVSGVAGSAAGEQLNLLNHSTNARSLYAGIDDFRFYDWENRDPSYTTPEAMILDIMNNPDRPLA